MRIGPQFHEGPMMRQNGAVTSQTNLSPQRIQPKHGRRRWGWLIALVALGLVLAMLVAGFFISNGLTTAAYAQRIASGQASFSLQTAGLNGGDAIPVSDGSDWAVLHLGAGHEPGSAQPGAVGNCVVSAYRFGWGQPFAQLDQLASGDSIVVTAAEQSWTYTVITGPTLVSADDATVLAPVPGDADLQATTALLTLVTSGSILPSPQRLVLVAQLAD
ncbi:MAG: class E sortase [Propionibacteriaceae bacterium]|jgi:sortase A|nr:class E sortase [Propionibacteriaceae bacterium]